MPKTVRGFSLSTVATKRKMLYNMKAKGGADMAVTIVIGGGAAGMAAAIAAAEAGDRVTVLERMDRVGKKLLATGNGRCNLMNTGAWQPDWNGSRLAIPVLERCGAEEQTRFWLAHGLRMRTEDGGRVYPASGQASTVLDVLRMSMDAAGVEICTGVRVEGLQQKGKTWSVKTDVGIYKADRVIVTGGGSAQPKLGSDGSCYALLQSVGHRLVTPRPALTQIETDLSLIRGLSGIRVRCGVSVVSSHGKVLHEKQGEALFTDYGVSGVCVMQCAAWAETGGEIRLELLQGFGMTKAEMTAELTRRRAQWFARPMEALLTGLCVPRLSMAVGKAAGVAFRDRSIGMLKDDEIRRLTVAMAGFPLRIKGVKGFDTAQVTAGGIAVDDFDPVTMASTLAPGLHAAGEVLDVDGTCGGFNLMFAFGSGILAGRNGRNV